MNYSKYNAYQFATDDSFIRWVRSPDTELDRFWEKFLQENPHKKPDVEKARRVLHSIQIKGDEWPVEREGYIKTQILDLINLNDTFVAKRSFRIWKKKYWNVAAILIGLLSIFAISWLKINNKTHYYQTEYGVTEEIRLPDGSLVILNANSTLAYTYSWWSDRRQVTLDGEAFFHVEKTADNSIFDVTSGDILTEVLGTAFSIRSRRGNTRVILESGSVKLVIPQDKANANVIMRPGELIEYNENKVIQKKDINIHQYDGLKEHLLIFNQTTLKEVAIQVKDIYGVTLYFPENMKAQSFTAKIPVNKDGIEILNTLLKESFDLEIDKRTDSLYVFEKGV